VFLITHLDFVIERLDYDSPASRKGEAQKDPKLTAHFAAISNDRLIKRYPEDDIQSLALPEGPLLSRDMIVEYVRGEFLKRDIFKPSVWIFSRKRRHFR
jgi:hypothetical protein